jgi:mRNA interferase MazF
MTSSTTYSPGSVVMVRVTFTRGTETKKRPAVILSVGGYHNSRADAVMMALSTQMSSTYFGDYPLRDWQTAGLPKPTKARGVIQTIERSTIEQDIGSLSGRDLGQVQASVRKIMGL